ncbi:microsomal glutathione S-transferase 1-like [Gigantopelta aegis]|uniref:microsomal glutathione S-transferase 1-like n=1 Tax=Gigantopelta aegis TaxID=1735272 RepID=UPI001B88CE9A|nr:microsomal glutathione S-transferase 1-like [Gigantopelta aegis]
MVTDSPFTTENPVFANFVFYATIVVLKMMLMSGITAAYRITNKVFINPEDASSFGKQTKLVTNNPGVERIRRCHLNDLENVIPFVLIGLLYVATGPSLSSALLHFRLFAGSRLAHTVVYLLAVPQPARAILFTVGILATASMAVSTLLAVSF